MKFWTPPKLFDGKTVVLIGGGPSLRDFDLEPTRKAKVITVNNACFLAPWTDVIFFGDRRWWRWYGAKVPEKYAGRIITTAMSRQPDPRILRMGKEYKEPLSPDPYSLSGVDSGTQAIDLAVHLGARKLVLLGYDMGFAADGESHWHADHQEPSREHDYVDTFAPQYPALLEALAERGIEIVRCTPSNLHMIPQVSLAEALA